MLGAAAQVQALPSLALSNPQSFSMNVQLPRSDSKLLWVSPPALGLVGPDTTAYMARKASEPGHAVPYCACCRN